MRRRQLRARKRTNRRIVHVGNNHAQTLCRLFPLKSKQYRSEVRGGGQILLYVRTLHLRRKSVGHSVGMCDGKISCEAGFSVCVVALKGSVGCLLNTC